MALIFSRCPGRVPVSDNRSWYVPAGKTVSECTYCEACYELCVKGTLADSGFTKKTGLLNCNCDYPKDYSRLALQHAGVRVSVVDSTTQAEYPLLEGENETIANLNGVAHVVVPTCASYAVSVENVETSADSYFTLVSGTVGDKDIVINNGETIYYNRVLQVKGFKTNSDESFLFMSQSAQEKSEGIKPLATENVSNIIKLRVQKFKKVVPVNLPTVVWPRRTYRTEQDSDYSDYMDIIRCTPRNVYPGRTSYSYDQSCRQTFKQTTEVQGYMGQVGSIERCGGDRSESTRRSCDSRSDEAGRLSEAGRSPFLSAGHHIGINTVGTHLKNTNVQLRTEPDASGTIISGASSDVRQISLTESTGNNVSGGATLAGGTFVENIQTTITNDLFEKVGEPIDFVVQLVCTQDDATKYMANRKHQTQIDFKKREKLQAKVAEITQGVTRLTRDLESVQANIDREEEKLKGLAEEMRAYDYLGSTNKQDHLLQFEK